MEILNIFYDNNKITIKLDGVKANESFDIFLMERFELGIWDYHKNSFPFVKINENEYEFDLLDILPKIRTCQDVVMDIKTSFGFIKTKLEPNQISSISKTTSTSYGKLKFEPYKNGSSGISIKIRLSPIKFNLKFISETKNNLIFYVSSSSIKYYLVRKNKSYENSFDQKIPLKVSNNNIKINKQLFFDKVTSKEETWLIVSLNDEQVCYASFIGFIDYQTKIKNLDIILTSVKTDLSIKVYKNVNDSYDKIKICVIGSCFTRLAFRSLDYYNKDYKDLYTVPYTVFHMSIPSIVSNKIDYNKNDLVGKKQKDLNIYGKDNFDKNIFENLKNINPDYIIIDNYSSITNDLIETNTGSYIDNNYYLKNTEAIKKLKTKKIYKNTSDDFFNIFKNSIKTFKQKIQDILPLNKIILVRCEPAIKKFENGVIKDWENSQIIKMRKYLLNKFDSYFISQMENINVIDLRDQNKYFSDISPISEFQPNHLNSIFYQDLLNCINKVILVDKLKKS